VLPLLLHWLNPSFTPLSAGDLDLDSEEQTVFDRFTSDLAAVDGDCVVINFECSSGFG